ncbi:MAG: hypothetical protein NTX52_05630, partial [Planctomycetota bacterium]|nr:hypothetical protein [Planctomycetota bacterium]
MCRKLIYLVLVLWVVAGLSSDASAQLITSVVRFGSANTAPAIAKPLQDGALCYVDRTPESNPPGGHQYKDFPPELPVLIGAEYVKTANADKDVDNLTMQVTLSKQATIFLLLDNRMGGAGGGKGVNPILDAELTAWINHMGFVDTGYDIGIDENGDGSINNYFSLFKTVLPAGTRTFGEQHSGGSRNMYAVAVVAPLLKAYDPVPPDGAKDVMPSRLQWSPGGTAVAHDVYLGTDAAGVTNATTSSIGYYKEQTNVTESIVTGLTALTTYYWRIDEYDANDNPIPYKGDVWSFTTSSLKAYNPSPADGALGVDPNVILSWSAGFKAKPLGGHDVYLGTDAAGVAIADTSSPEFMITRSLPSYDHPTRLANDTTYY